MSSIISTLKNEIANETEQRTKQRDLQDTLTTMEKTDVSVILKKKHFKFDVKQKYSKTRINIHQAFRRKEGSFVFKQGHTFPNDSLGNKNRVGLGLLKKRKGEPNTITFN